MQIKYDYNHYISKHKLQWKKNQEINKKNLNSGFKKLKYVHFFLNIYQGLL